MKTEKITVSSLRYPSVIIRRDDGWIARDAIYVKPPEHDAIVRHSSPL